MTETALNKARDAIVKAELAWRQSQQRERKAKDRRDRAIRRAHRDGAGYGTIAKWLDEIGYGVTRAAVQQICRRGQP
jgi:hypothetical protein